MNILDIFINSLFLIISFDKNLWDIILLSLYVSFLALIIASIFGIFFGITIIWYTNNYFGIPLWYTIFWYTHYWYTIFGIPIIGILFFGIPFLIYPFYLMVYPPDAGKFLKNVHKIIRKSRINHWKYKKIRLRRYKL